MRIKRWIFLVLILLVVAGYLYCADTLTVDGANLTVDTFTKRVTTVTTLIAAVAFWLTYSNNAKITEASYIKDLNNQFIVNQNMFLIEHDLEVFFNKRKNGEVCEMSKKYTDFKEEDHQHVINYLVYLESFAAIVKSGAIRFKAVDDVFAYRFFIAVNNPALQESELKPFKEYYRGIIWLSKRWTRYRKTRHLHVPMEENSLYKNVS